MSTTYTRNMRAHLDATHQRELAQDQAEHPRRAHPVQADDPVLRALSTAEAAFNRYAAHHLRQAGMPGEDAAKRHQQAAENADLAQAMREGILAHYARSYRVPQGWRLAPCEPTIAMLQAGTKARWIEGDTTRDAEVWRRMIAAAPQPPTQAQHPDDAAVDLFADAMKAKLAAVRANEHGGQYDPEQYCVDHLARLLVERQPLTDSAWLKRWTKDFCERLKPGPRRNEVLGIIRFCERHHGIMGGKEGGAA